MSESGKRDYFPLLEQVEISGKPVHSDFGARRPEPETPQREPGEN